MEINGSDGIPREGREAEYAADLWLDGPSAFWLHPEGPLSETTPDEWREKRAEAEQQRREAQLQNPYANAYNQLAAMQRNGMMNAGFSSPFTYNPNGGLFGNSRFF